MDMFSVKMKDIFSVVIVLVALFNLAYSAEEEWVDYRLLTSNFYGSSEYTTELPSMTNTPWFTTTPDVPSTTDTPWFTTTPEPPSTTDTPWFTTTSEPSSTTDTPWFTTTPEPPSTTDTPWFTTTPEILSTSDWPWITTTHISSTATTTLPTICTVPGPKCADDCRTLYFCTRVGDELIPEYLDTCRGRQTCNRNRCSKIPSLECAVKGIDFECRSLEGMYPDPGSCKKFHHCISLNGNRKLNKTTSICHGNYGYNPRTTYCDVPLPNGACSADLTPLCKKPGDNGALKQNPTLYYICSRYVKTRILYPYIYMCANGKRYNETLLDCQ